MRLLPRPSKRWVRFVAMAIAGGVLALATLRLIPSTNRALGPAEVSARAGLGSGRTVLFVPPLGTVAASTHLPPIRFELTLNQVDLPVLGTAIAHQSSRAALARQVEDGLRDLAVDVALRLLIGGAVVGAITAAVVTHRRWPMIVAGTAGGIAGIVAVLGLTVATFEVESFDEPRFSGALKRAPEVIEALNRAPSAFENLSSRFRTAASRLSGLLALVAEPNPNPSVGTTAILHVSDIHSNPIGLEIVDQLVNQFDVKAVLDTGDLTSFGQPIEARLGELIEDIDVPYLYVPGNHDSFFNRKEINKVENVTLLDERPTSAGGVKILGWPDPTFTATNETSTEKGNELRLAEAPVVATNVERVQPDVLAVHDERLAEESMGTVRLVLAGHTHERGVDTEDGTLVLTVGSSGATGLGSFIVEANLDYEAQVIYFRMDRAVAVDYIRFRGLGGDFVVERTTFESEPEPAE